MILLPGATQHNWGLRVNCLVKFFEYAPLCLERIQKLAPCAESLTVSVQEQPPLLGRVHVGGCIEVNISGS